MSKFVRTLAINKIAAMKARKKVIQGGSSAGKTFGILPILINKALKKPMLEITVVAGTIAHLKTGAMKDFLKIMVLTGRFDSNRWHKSDRKYTFSNGSYIEFVNADQDKATGARRNILYINEANKGVTYDAYLQFASRTDNDIYIDFNPANKFWAHTEVLEEPDSEHLILTYLDNKDIITKQFAVAQTIVDDLLHKREKAKTSKFWENWCKVYIDGEIGALEGTIFQYDVIDKIPIDAELLGYGMDFGYTNDPTTLIAVYKWKGKIILHELLYRKGLKLGEIASIIKQLQLDKTKRIWSDRDNRLVDDLKAYGINIKMADKGQGSILQGIHVMLEYELLITESSENLINELDNYMWMEKGNKDIPIDAFNHLIDAARYLFWMLLGKKRDKEPSTTSPVRRIKR